MREFFTKTPARLLIILIIFLGIGFYAGRASIQPSAAVTNVSNMETGKPTTVDFEPFWEAWNLINERHVGNEEIGNQEKVWGAIEGLANSLNDPYSVFLPPEETNLFEEMISGSFGGVGMEIGEKEDTIVVISPLKGTPAERAGIQSGDFVVSIDGESTMGMSVDEAVKNIRGEAGTDVTLEIAREGNPEFLSFTITRDNIVVPTLATETRDDVFIVSLYNFDALATTDFRKAMAEFTTSPADKLIIDLRGNPGGFLDAAVDISSYFVPAGELIVAEHSEKDSSANSEHVSKGFALTKKPTKIVVLINGGSASASEIVAGALQEHGIATLVGTQSFGKGSVQELIPLTIDTSLKLTVAKWLTPKGNSISDGGLTPDIVVETEPDTIGTPEDAQLKKALEVVRE